MSFVVAERFDIGRVIARTSGVIRRNMIVFARLALLLSGLPTALLGLARMGLASSNDAVNLGLSLSWLLNVLISAWLQAALIHGSISDLNGGRASFGLCLRTATADILPLIGVSIATTAAVALGLIFFIVPGVALGLMLSVSTPVRVVERTGVFAALGRSGDLTRGHRWMVLGLVALFGVGLFVSQVVVSVVTAPLALLGSTGVVLQTALITPVVSAISALVGAAGIASLYFELRTVKEGVGIEALAAAFD